MKCQRSTSGERCWRRPVQLLLAAFTITLMSVLVNGQGLALQPGEGAKKPKADQPRAEENQRQEAESRSAALGATVVAAVEGEGLRVASFALDTR